MTASVNAATFATNAAGTSGSTNTISAAGNIALVMVMINSGAFVTSITDTLGDTAWVSVLGTYGNTGTGIAPGAFRMSAFYCYYGSSGNNAITVNLSATSGAFFAIVYYDCTSIASATPFVGGMGGQQNSVANGTNTVTIAGGTAIGNGDNIQTVPALICAMSHTTGGTLSAGTSPITLTSCASNGNTNRAEFGVAASTGVFDSTFTLAGGASPTVTSFQIGLAASGGGASTPILGQIVM
jgi:hypothetical protein